MLIFGSITRLPAPARRVGIFTWWVISPPGLLVSGAGHLWLLVTNTQWSVTGQSDSVTWRLVTMTPPQNVTPAPRPGTQDASQQPLWQHSWHTEWLHVTTFVTHRVTPREDATFVVTKQSMTTSFTITRWFRNLFSTMTLASLTLSFKHLENWKGGFEWRAEEEL